MLAFWFDFASTYSYPSAMRIAARAEAAGVDIAWRPFLLGPIFGAQGWTDSPFNIYAAKGRYMWRDLERVCAAEGLPWHRPEIFPARSLLAARVAMAGADAQWLPGYIRAVFHANFADGEDISRPEVLARALAAAGGPEEALAAAELTETKAALRARVEEAQRLEIFGAPSFVVDSEDGPELFWGHDRLVDALDWARLASRAQT